MAMGGCRRRTRAKCEAQLCAAKDAVTNNGEASEGPPTPPPMGRSSVAPVRIASLGSLGKVLEGSETCKPSLTRPSQLPFHFEFSKPGRLLKLKRVFPRPTRDSEKPSSPPSENTPVVSSGLIDGDPFANLCVGASRVRDVRVALEPYLPAQESHFVPLPGYLSPIQDPPYTTPLAPNKIRGENVETPPPHDDRYSDNWLTATNYCFGDATGRPETPLLDENPRFEIEEILNLPVGHPQAPRFRESFVCDNAVFVPSLLPSEMERNLLPDYASGKAPQDNLGQPSEARKIAQNGHKRLPKLNFGRYAGDLGDDFEASVTRYVAYIHAESARKWDWNAYVGCLELEK
ncbi:hypothetical protein B0H13DRAFT_1850308 [Mycena leptocephala]|nr:hypothetical protein B0H13DRAFT_1850308 [Mycena leptocephala]